MALISRLGVVLGLDSGEFNTGLGKAETGLKNFGLSTTAMVGALAAAGTAFAAFGASALQYADSINDVAKANEVSAASILEFSQALSMSGGKTEDVGKIYSSFTNKLDEARTTSQKLRNEFGELGISEKELANLSQQAIFEKAIASLGTMEDTTRRNAIMFDLLGKSMKTVDAKGLAEAYQDAQGKMTNVGKSFEDIGDGMDALGRITATLKTDVARDFGGMFKDMMIGTEHFIQWMNSTALPAMNHTFNNLVSIIPFFGKEWAMPKIKTPELPKDFGLNKEAMDSGWGDAPDKKLAKTAEQIAAEKKLSDELSKQKENLNQQLLSLQYQANTVGDVKSKAGELAIEFEKGGKYARLKGTADAQALIDAATLLDQKIKEHDLEGEIYKLQVKEAQEQAKKIKAGEDALAAVIERHQADQEAFDLSVEDINIQAQRLAYQKEIAGLSETQQQKALEYFDLQQKIMKMSKDPSMSQADIDKFTTANQKLLEQEENTKRAQNTFQAGWSKAYETYKEKAMDSASEAANAFNSMAQGMENALDSFVTTGKLSFSDLAQSIISDMLKMALKAQMSGFFGSIFGGSGGGGISDMFSGIFGGGYTPLPSFVPAYADGGEPAVGKVSLVGERGPELFVPKSAGTIIPNHSLSGMMGSQPQVVYNGPYINSMSAIDTQSATQFLAQNKTAVWSANQSAQRSMPQSR